MDMSIRITALRGTDNGAAMLVAVSMEAEGGALRETRSFRILPEQYRALRLRRGEIDRETVDALEEASRLCEAVRRGMSLLGCGMQSARALRQKLCARGFDAALAAEAVAYLRACGLLDECADAQRVVAQCRRKHWGARRILACLFEKGYPEATVREVQAQLEGEDFVSDCIALIRARWRTLPQTREEQQKLTAALMRYGYATGEIRRALAALQEHET